MKLADLCKDDDDHEHDEEYIESLRDLGWTDDDADFLDDVRHGRV